jgi:hypothetical protein
MKNTRSISAKLKHSKSAEESNLIIAVWHQAWHEEQIRYIRRLEYAIANDSYDDLCIATGRLKSLTTRKFRGLETILKHYQHQEGKTS